MNLRSLTQWQCLLAGFLMGMNAMGILFNAFRGEWMNVGFCSLLLASLTYGLYLAARKQSRAHA